MPSPGMLCSLVLVRTNVSEQSSASIIRVTRIGEVRTTLKLVVFLSVRRLLLTTNDNPCSPIVVTLVMEELLFSGTSVLTRATRRTIPEDGILHSHSCENLKPYIVLTGWTL
jgi:hypothetical protein